jgi:hypothetical protein
MSGYLKMGCNNISKLSFVYPLLVSEVNNTLAMVYLQVLKHLIS